MSAASIVIAAAPSAGPVAARSSAAKTDADFAAMVDDAAPAETPPPSRPPVSKAETKAAPLDDAPVEDAALPEPDAGAEAVIDATVVVAVAPPLPLAQAMEVALTVDAKGSAPAVAEPSGAAQPDLPPETGTPPLDAASAGEPPVPAPSLEPAAVASAEPTEAPTPAPTPTSKSLTPTPTPTPSSDAALDAPVDGTAAPVIAEAPTPAPALAPAPAPALAKPPVPTLAKAPAPESAQPVVAPAALPEAPERTEAANPPDAALLPEAAEPAPAVAKPAATPQPAATPAPATPTAVAVPAPRPARVTTEVPALEAPPAGDTASDPTAAPVQAAPASAPVPAEPPRTRDVIERAQAARPDASGDATGGAVDADASPAAAKGAQPAAAPTPSAPASTVAGPMVPPAGSAVPPAGRVDDAAINAAPGAHAATSEARPAETAVSLSLSTTSRASVETTAQIAAQIVRKLEGRSTRFEMALTPEGLGQVDVSLDIDADGKLVARMAFDNPLAATELRGRADELRRQLQEAGFTVADDALSFAERDPSSSQGRAFDERPSPRNARAFGAASRLEADADRLVTPARWIPLTLAPDRVDMKV